MNNKELNEQLKVLIEKNDDLLAQTKVLKDQLQVKHVVIDTHVECQEKYAKLKAERYEYMIRYYAYFDNDKQHRKQIADQEVLFDKMSVQLVELDNHVRDLKNTVLEKDFKIFELKECVRNKDLKIEKCLERLNVCENKLHKMGQTNQTVHMIMPSKDILYNGQKGIGFENPRYFEKAKDLRLSLYDEKVIGLGYTLMFLTHSDEALEIKKFKRARENKIEFAYDYGSLNASYVNEKINFSDDYFQEIINPDFEKIDSPFQQTSSLKQYVSTVILEKIIIDLEYEVVRLLEKEKANLKTIESLKSKGFESSENAISDPENQSENDCHVVEKEYDQVENSKVIAPGMFKIVQICLWIIDSGCSNHMTDNRALLVNFVKKFLGTVRFGNNDFAVIAGYGDNASTKWCHGKEESNLSRSCKNYAYICKPTIVSWAEAIAPACFTQNHLIIHKRFDKTPYEIMNKRKPNIKFFRVFGWRCYLLNDYEDVGKLKAKEDIGVFVGYSKESAAFGIYNKRTRKIHESVNVNFDEISEMASKQFSLEPGLSNLNETGNSSNPSISKVSEASKKDLEDLF
nr:retrovirus-related Pol polyprotein from transposon TNT 1-94 [Tanacetum cinerariifolium]